MSNRTPQLEGSLPPIPRCRAEDRNERDNENTLQLLQAVTLPTPLEELPGFNIAKVQQR